MSESKSCAKCKQVFPTSDFRVVRKNGREYPHSYCRPCQSVGSKGRGPEYYRKYWEGMSEEQRKAVRDRSIEKRRLRQYGLTQERFDELADLQYDVCAGCMRPLIKGSQAGVPSSERTVVDHSHVTGAVRGLLCGNCNRVLGLVKDDVLTLRSLAHYLEEAP